MTALLLTLALFGAYHGVTLDNREVVCLVYDTTGGMTVDATPAVVSFDSHVVVDDYYSHNTEDNPSRVTVYRSGLYMVNYAVNTIYASNRHSALVYVRRNGSEILPATSSFNYGRGASAVNIATCSLGSIVQLDEGDYIELVVVKVSSGGTVTTSADYDNYLMLYRIR